MIKPLLEAEVENLGKIYNSYDTWSKSLKLLRSAGVEEPISSRDLVYAIHQFDEKHSLRNFGSYVKEGGVCIPKGPTLFVRESPLLYIASAEKATRLHSQGKEFYLDATMYQEQAEEDKNKDPQDRRVLALRNGGAFSIPCENFGIEELPLFLFRDQTENHSDFLKRNGIESMCCSLPPQINVDKEIKPFARQIWFSEIRGTYTLILDLPNLGLSSTVRGILRK
jgi:hypothetical protein